VAAEEEAGADQLQDDCQHQSEPGGEPIDPSLTARLSLGHGLLSLSVIGGRRPGCTGRAAKLPAMNIWIDALLSVSLITTAITTNKIIAAVVVLVIIIAVGVWYMRRSRT
jgi:hypothetical protein